MTIFTQKKKLLKLMRNLNFNDIKVKETKKKTI